MKNIKIIFVLFIFIFIPFIGYYEHHEEISSTPVIFWKKKPSLQIKFYRIFHPNFESGLHELTEIQRLKVIDYCKYRLGIETTLKTEEDFKACRDDLTGE